MSDVTPMEIEGLLRRILNELTKAQLELQSVRDQEVDAKHAYLSVYRKAMLESPRVGRGGMTTGERDAWVAQVAEDEERAYNLAEAKRRAAEDRLRTLRDQAVVLTALAKSVSLSFGMAGVS